MISLKIYSVLEYPVSQKNLLNNIVNSKDVNQYKVSIDNY